MSATNADLKKLSDALDVIDTATTQAGVGVGAVQQRITALLGQIGEGTDPATVKVLAERATNEAASLGAIAKALTDMGKADNPVPTPVPAPNPGPVNPGPIVPPGPGSVDEP